MTKLRDVELRFESRSGLNDPRPEFKEIGWKSCVVETLFYRELRALKIETPGFVKINIYCESKSTPYFGDFFDRVTNVQIAANCGDIGALPVHATNEVFLKFLISGVSEVLEYFDIDTAGVVAIGEKMRRENFYLSTQLGSRLARSIETKLSAALYVRSGQNLEYCVVVACVFKGKNIVGEIPIFTTYPSPRYAFEEFISLEWSNSQQLIAVFFASINDQKKVFGRSNFDSNNFSGVTREYTMPDEKFTFSIDLSSILAGVR